MNILVTGGAGFIGSHIVNQYLDDGHNVIVLDDLSCGKKENIDSRAVFYQGDIRDVDFLENLFIKENIDVINHHAAQKNVRLSIENPVLDADINIIGTLKLLTVARDFAVKKIIFASSASVYGNSEKLPLSEKMKVQPIDPYGITKHAVENYLYSFSLLYNIPTILFRYANVYGPRQDPHGEAGVISIFVDCALNAKPPLIYGDGRQTRDFLYVGDVVQANRIALNTGITGIFNIATNKETSINDVYLVIRNFFKKAVDPKYDMSHNFGVKRSLLISEKMYNTTGWKSNVDVESGIKLFIDWYRNNIKN